MRLKVLGCAGGSAPGHLLTCFLLDDALAVDAGALTTALDFRSQRRVQDVLLTHAHLDHVWTLPLFLANRFGGQPVPCRVHGSQATLDAVREHFFNDRVWPDFTTFVRDDVPLVQFVPLEAGATARVLEYEVEAVPMHHTVPTQSYLVRRGGRSLLLCGDTYESDAIWARANEADDLAGLLIECSFPDRFDRLAKASLHLTPRLLGRELQKLRRDVPVLVSHIKPEEREEVLAQIDALGDRRIRVLRQGEEIPL